MLVDDLKEGMMVQPSHPHLSFRVRSWAAQEIKVLEVCHNRKEHIYRGELTPVNAKQVMYLGDRKKLQIKSGFSNRFVLVNGNIHAVEPSDWHWLKPVK